MEGAESGRLGGDLVLSSLSLSLFGSVLTLKNNDNPQSSSLPLELESRRFVG